MTQTKQTYKDPVCGMQVTSETAAGQSTYNGKIYYFCSRADKDAFDRNPEKYVKTTVSDPLPR
ncbi:MAG: YHS domain-containing protein [Anaerolineales bacterium]|nr:YHS domain-containing protein [Anaerolineales bacterium]